MWNKFFVLFLILIVLILLFYFPSSGCFLVRNTFLGKSYQRLLTGSLVFRGKISDQASNKQYLGEITLYRGKPTWNTENRLKLSPSYFHSDKWTDVTVTARFKKSTQSDTSCRTFFFMNSTYKSEKVQSKSLVFGACVPAPRLRLYFQETNDTEWSYCTTKNSPSNFFPGTIPSTDTTHIMQIMSNILVVVCLLLVMALTATCVHMQRVKEEIKKHLPRPLYTNGIIQLSGQFWLFTKYTVVVAWERNCLQM